MQDVAVFVFNNFKKIAAGLFALMILSSSYTIIQPGERGVYVVLGKASDTVMEEGFHTKLPFVSDVRVMSVRVQKSESGSEAASKDLQRVSAVLALNWHINPSSVSTLIKTVGNEADIHERIIKPAVSEVLKAATAKLSAEEILTKRMELKSTIDALLTERLKQYSIIIDDISLTNLDFTREFNESIEKKQIAEQQAKQAEYVALKATQDAKAEVNAAKGEAESNLIRAKAQSEAQKLLQLTLTKDVLALEYLKKWDGVLPTVMGGQGSAMMFNVDLNKSGSTSKSTGAGN